MGMVGVLREIRPGISIGRVVDRLARRARDGNGRHSVQASVHGRRSSHRSGQLARRLRSRLESRLVGTEARGSE